MTIKRALKLMEKRLTQLYKCLEQCHSILLLLIEISVQLVIFLKLLLTVFSFIEGMIR